jgi:SAM-dependent methyltransferase
MGESWRTSELPEIVATLASRPRHETLRALIFDILHAGFGAAHAEIGQEVYLCEGRGRIDTMFGATVIELKSDLRRELRDVEARLPDYLADAARRTRRRVTGLATDGATFIAYVLQDGQLAEIGRHETDPQHPDALLAWLEPALSDREDLPPEPRTMQRELGRGSLTFGSARADLIGLWNVLHDDPEVALKRQLWDGLLREAYGAPVGDDLLFLQHTYLSIVVKAIAARVLGLPVDDPRALLDGRKLAEEGLHGAVEADFFDWLLKLPAGAELVRRVARQAARFRLREMEADVLKALYESLVDPEQRHDLGEYYTPDWLAAKVAAAAVANPLTDRVLDPACGSGTFLFHALRRLVAAARAAGWNGARTLRACAGQVRGLDIHPVAVIIARVTWLLALGDLILERNGSLRVPVFLGDAMQWNVREFTTGRDVIVTVPDEDRPLQVPLGFAEDQAKFEAGLDAMNDGLRDEADRPTVERALRRIANVNAADAAALADTFAQLQTLFRAGRNGIWTFVLRNLVRPVWLSREDQRADVLLGNPPWIAYRHLSAEMKERLRSACRGYDLWVGGKLATQQDMCALFWARGAERYLKQGGTIAFVLPYAVLNGPVYAALRSGRMGQAPVRIVAGWSLEKVWPIFGAPSGVSTTSTCVLIGRREPAGAPPDHVERWVGHLPRRDAPEAEADRRLAHAPAPWPKPRTLLGASPYRARFRDGATIYPRRFFLVEPEPPSRFGPYRPAPRMHGRTSNLDKAPWNAIEPPRGPVEVQFLRPLVLGETIAPFRLLLPAVAVIPLDGSTLLDSAAASWAGHRHLATWLRDIEGKWAAHCHTDLAGRPRMTLLEQVDHMHKLSRQVTSPGRKVVYTKAGTKLSAALLDNALTIVDHKAYWMTARNIDEAHYLLAVINSGFVLAAVASSQSHGQRDPRDFDKLVWTLPIPGYDETIDLHRDLAAAAARAGAVAAAAELPEGAHFTAKRRAIRAALAADGIAREIEILVAALLAT